MKKAQAWGFDVMIATSLFISGIILFYFFALNASPNGDTKYDEIDYNANTIAESLLSEGLPQNWDNNTVARIGILTNDKINNTKLERFHNLTEINYAGTQRLFETHFDYFVNLSDPIMINGEYVEGMGHPPINAETVARSTRFTVYNNKPVSMEVLVWK